MNQVSSDHGPPGCAPGGSMHRRVFVSIFLSSERCAHNKPRARLELLSRALESRSIGSFDARCLGNWFSTCHCEAAWPLSARLHQRQMSVSDRRRLEADRRLSTIPGGRPTAQI